MKTDLESGMVELEKHARRRPAIGNFDFCGLTVDEAKAIVKELKCDTYLYELVREILDVAVSYGEYILTKEDMEALAGATGYELPED